MQRTDSDIIKKIQRGDKASFEKLFKEYYPSLCRYSFQYVKIKESAEEIVQDLFFNVWKNKAQLSIHSSLKAYLYKATYFNSMAFLRTENVRSAHIEFLKGNKETSTRDGSLEHKELKTIIDATLRTLPERGRLIFTMSRFEGLKYKEIADRLSISVKTVEANMGKALKLFRNNLKDYVGMFLL